MEQVTVHGETRKSLRDEFEILDGDYNEIEDILKELERQAEELGKVCMRV